jgi:hypothetical protein
MSHIDTPDGLAGHRDRAPVGGNRRPRTASLVAGSILCVVALLFLAGGGWAMWKDRVDRDGDGFVSLGTSHLRTEQYAIVGDLKGDGPGWFYGSTVLGDERVRATSQAEQPLFIGIASKDDVLRYLRGAGYATVDSFQVRADTTHPGGPPTGPPSEQSIWAASTQGTGEQTLLWSPRSGNWSVVLMNADASANVGVRGDASAKLPILPWVAGAFLSIGVAAALSGVWVFVRAIHRANRSGPSAAGESHESTSGGVLVGARS